MRSLCFNMPQRLRIIIISCKWTSLFNILYYLIRLLFSLIRFFFWVFFFLAHFLLLSGSLSFSLFTALSPPLSLPLSVLLFSLLSSFRIFSFNFASDQFCMLFVLPFSIRPTYNYESSVFMQIFKGFFLLNFMVFSIFS